MSSRTRERSRGGRSSFNTGRPPRKKKTVKDYFFYIGSKRQASDFEVCSEFLINHIKKDFNRGNDIAEALRTLRSPDTNSWKPILRRSKQKDQELKNLENEQMKMEFKAELDECMKRI